MTGVQVALNVISKPISYCDVSVLDPKRYCCDCFTHSYKKCWPLICSVLLL